MAGKIRTGLVGLAIVAAACSGGGDTGTSTTTTVAAGGTTTSTAAAATSSTTTTTTTTPTSTVAPVASGFATTIRELFADNALEVRSAQFEGVFAFTSDGTDGTENAEMTFSGAFDLDAEATRFSFDFGNVVSAFGGGGDLAGFDELFAEPMEVVTIGGTSYLKWSLFTFFLGPDVKWVELDETDADSFVSGFSFGLEGASPIAQIEGLAGAGANVENLGSEDVRGIETTNYRVIVDTESLAAGLSGDEAAELRESFGASGLDSFPMEFWIGTDGLLYRYRFSIDATGLEGAQGIGGVEVTYEIFGYNQPVDIQAPPADEVSSGEGLGSIFGS